MPSSGTGALPTDSAGGSRFVCVASGSPITECTRPPECQLLRERNVCYASPPVCPHAGPASKLFVAMSAQESLLGKRKLSARISSLP